MTPTASAMHSSRSRRGETFHAYAVPVVRELPPRPVPVTAGW